MSCKVQRVWSLGTLKAMVLDRAFCLFSLLVLFSVLWLLKNSHCVQRGKPKSLKSQTQAGRSLTLLLISIFVYLCNLSSYLVLWTWMFFLYKGLEKNHIMCCMLYPPEVYWCWALTEMRTLKSVLSLPWGGSQPLCAAANLPAGHRGAMASAAAYPLC